MALFSHKRDANARSTRPVPTAVKVAAPVALLATLSTVGVGVMASQPGADLLATNAAGSISGASASVPEREIVVSRSDVRQSLGRAERELARDEAAAERRATERAIKRADTRLWTTAPLNLWTDSAKKAEKRGLLGAIERVLVTGRKADGRTEVVVDGQARWVTSGYLVADKPKPERERTRSRSGGGSSSSTESESSSAPSLGGTCSNGTSVSGQPNVIGVHEVVCANFPEITSYGTYRADGEHAQGLAIDIMTSGARGWEVAEFLRANYSELGINYIMYSQKIWSVDRAGEGWRYVEDRGSATANHYDHVHVTTY